jgi:GT2 family glycosyltransferase
MSEPASGGAKPRVSAVVVNFEAGQALLECIESVAGEDVAEVVVVDNGSRDGSAAAAAAAHPEVVLLTQERNVGFAGGGNVGARAASGDLLLFLNPDVRLGGGAVRAMVDEFAVADVGVVGPPLHVGAAGYVDHGGTVDVLGSSIGVERGGRPLYVPGCALMTPAALFAELGGFDDRYFLFVEDVDYCWRVLLRGLDVRVPDIDPVWHEGGAVAPGGYVTTGRLTSTLLRVRLRERNTLAMLIKCYRAPLVCAVAPLYVAQSLATAGVMALSGRGRTARAVVSGIAWNLVELRRTLQLRRQVQRTRAVGDGAIVRRMHRGVVKLSLLRRLGIPSVVEGSSAADVPRRSS